MENKKQQNYSGVGNSKTSSQTSDSNRQKSSSDIQNNKHWPRNSRRRENPTTTSRNNNSKQQLSAKVRPNVDKRPRGRGYNYHNTSSSYHSSSEDSFAGRTGLVTGDTTFFASLDAERVGHNDYELNSVYSPGSKKQNLNHLLNFYYTPREVDYHDGVRGSYVGSNVNSQRHNHVKKQKYNKEQFLQANFQFVIKASAKRKTDGSPDTLIDWPLIEQINIQTPDEPQCPICLYPPVAAKVTRCGHVYCWPCVLHYLALSDKSWRKCPICYDAVQVADLKSASIVQQQDFKLNSQITLRLMRRKKGSLFIETVDSKKSEQNLEKYPYVGSPIEEKLFSKFILAKRKDVADILAREQRELLADADKSCPEYVFIQQALELLRQRTEKLGELEQRDEKFNKLEEITHEVTNYEKSSGIKGTEQFFNNNIVNSSEVVECAANLLPIKEQLNSFDEETSSEIKMSEQQATKKIPTNFHYFYQSDDGQNIYLHTINVKMLENCYGSLADAPSVITARIIQKDQHSMDEGHRSKFACLGHLPLTCQYAVVEIELQPPYVTEYVIKKFKSDLLERKNKRQRKAMEERKREKHINAINERQMGKIIASTANINLTSSHEFPTCGFEEPLVTPSENDLSDNVPSTSKRGRTKTESTSSAGSCSYSAIALHCKKEHAPWSTLNAAQAAKPSLSPTNVDQREIVDEDNSILSTTSTNLGDVLAQALSQKKDKKSSMSGHEAASSNSNKSVATKKSKKSKKMLPLYSTGMNFNGN